MPAVAGMTPGSTAVYGAHQNDLLHCRRWAGRDDARVLAGARRSRCRGVGEAPRFPARLPRRHYSSLDPRLMHELGLLEEFLKLPHQEARHLSGIIGDTSARIADFTRLPTHCKFIALMPQWDFLDLLAAQARRFPSFHLRMQAEVTDLIQEGGRAAGVHVKTPEGPLAVVADLVIGADGR